MSEAESAQGSPTADEEARHRKALADAIAAHTGGESEPAPRATVSPQPPPPIGESYWAEAEQPRTGFRHQVGIWVGAVVVLAIAVLLFMAGGQLARRPDDFYATCEDSAVAQANGWGLLGLLVSIGGTIATPILAKRRARELDMSGAAMALTVGFLLLGLASVFVLANYIGFSETCFNND